MTNEDQQHLLVSLSAQLDDAHAALDIMGVPNLNEAGQPYTVRGRIDYMREHADKLVFGIFGPYIRGGKDRE